MVRYVHIAVRSNATPRGLYTPLTEVLARATGSLAIELTPMALRAVDRQVAAESASAEAGGDLS
jgi:hypothetical protein